MATHRITVNNIFWFLSRLDPLYADKIVPLKNELDGPSFNTANIFLKCYTLTLTY